MLAAVLYGREDVRLSRLPVPQPACGEVCLRVRAALTCGTDAKVFRRGYHARMIVPPAVFGHEMAGTIDSVGEGVTAWQPGDRVVVANSTPCGACFFCYRNQESLCEDLQFLNGAYAQYLCVPPRLVAVNLHRIPDSLPFEVAALAEPLACALRGVEQTDLRPGEWTAVLGAGPIGLMFVHLAVAAGCRVVVLGRRAERLAAAAELGAERVLDESTVSDPVGAICALCNEGRGPDRVIEAVGRPETWQMALALVRPGGLVNLYGGCPGDTQVPLDAGRMHYGELTVRATFHHTPRHVRAALDLLAGGSLPASRLITQRAPLEALPGVLRDMIAGGGAIKTAILPNG